MSRAELEAALALWTGRADLGDPDGFAALMVAHVNNALRRLAASEGRRL